MPGLGSHFSLPADVGTVLKVISVPKESWNHMEPLVLEELQVFQVRRGLHAPPVTPTLHPFMLPMLWVMLRHSSFCDVEAGSTGTLQLLPALCPQNASPITSLQLSSKRVRRDPG